MGDDERIEELLEKLKELDSDAYMAWCELFHEIYDIDYDCIDWDSFAGAIYLLQGVIQDALDENGLTLETVSRRSGGEKNEVFWAKISRDTNGEDAISSCYGDSLANALLAAYILALEAEAAR